MGIPNWEQTTNSKLRNWKLNNTKPKLRNSKSLRQTLKGNESNEGIHRKIQTKVFTVDQCFEPTTRQTLGPIWIGIQDCE